MNSLLVNASSISGKATGIDNYTRSIIDNLTFDRTFILGCEDDFLTHSAFFVTPRYLSIRNKRIQNIHRLLWQQFRLSSMCKHLSIDLIYNPIPEAPLSSTVRSIVMVHDCIPLRFSKRYSLLNYYHQYYVPLVLKNVVHIICNSEATASDVVDFHGISGKKITPIMLAYDDRHFQPVCVNRNILSHRFFLYLGRHDPHKNLARIINAFQAGKFSDETELWLAGSEHPRHTPALRQQILELGLSERVKFLDYVPYEDLPRIISGAIALVFPSLWEGFGLPILEAMGCGTPVITSNLASMPEVAGDAAILVDPYKTNEIADAMEQVAADSQLRAKLSELGLARAKLFSWEKTGRETVEVLKRFL